MDKEASTDEDYTSLLNQIESFKSLVDSQRSLLEKQEQESKDTADKFDYLLAMKDKLIERLESRVASIEEEHRDPSDTDIKSSVAASASRGEGEEDAIEAPSEKYKVLESEYNKLDTAKMQLECDLIAARNEIDQMRAVVEKSGQVTDLMAQKSKIQSDVERLQAEIAEAEKQCLGNQQLYDRLRENVVEWENSNQAIEQQILELQERNANLGDQLVNISPTEKDQTIASLEFQLNDLKRQINDLDSIKDDYNRLK